MRAPAPDARLARWGNANITTTSRYLRSTTLRSNERWRCSHSASRNKPRCAKNRRKTNDLRKNATPVPHGAYGGAGQVDVVDPEVGDGIEDEVVTLTSASWTQIAGWLRQLDGLREQQAAGRCRSRRIRRVPDDSTGLAAWDTLSVNPCVDCQSNMRRVFFIVLSTILALAVWTGIFIVGALEGWWRQPLAPSGDSRAFMDAAIAEIDRTRPRQCRLRPDRERKRLRRALHVGRPTRRSQHAVPGRLHEQVDHGLGSDDLGEAGKLDLDAAVSTYLTRWSLPKSEFDNSGVTVRRLLSHTAGLTDGLGYGGFAPGQPVQPIVASLTRAADASPGADGAVRVGIEPGSAFEYSGGGYTLLQLIVEEASGQSFNDYLRSAVLLPLG